MPAMRNAAGKVIGATDGPGRGSCSLFACKKTASDRLRLGCTPVRSLSLDETLIDREDTEVADSAQARRILAACSGTLDTSDMGLVLDMLVDANKLSNMEASALKEKLNPQSETAATAMDAMFPHRHRLRSNHPLEGDARGMSALAKSFEMDRIKHDPYSSRPPGYGDNPNSRAETDAWLKKHFPNAERLK